MFKAMKNTTDLSTSEKIERDFKKLRSMGNNLPDEKLLALISKQYCEKKAKKSDKKSAKRWADRDLRSSVKVDVIIDMHAHNLANAMKNLPSSLRKR